VFKIVLVCIVFNFRMQGCGVAVNCCVNPSTCVSWYMVMMCQNCVLFDN
jgi:hypothetical protein